MQKSYGEELKDSRWQKKRLEIFNQDKFKCHWCSAGVDSGDTLHVHHLEYKRGKKPWEYSENDLITLCDTCHGQAEYTIKQLRRQSDDHLIIEAVGLILEMSKLGYSIEVSEAFSDLMDRLHKDYGVAI